MKTKKMLAILVLALGLVLWAAQPGEATEMGTAFTYQGHLYDANHVADGEYDFQFKLYDANSDGNQVGSDVNKADVDVIDGYFTVELDFGSEPNRFNGDARWLGIGVRPGDLNDPNIYTTLSPRQEITPTPYALHTRWLLVDTALDNVFAGEGAGASNTTGALNTFLGNYAGYSNTTGNSNTFSGFMAGQYNTTGHSNTFSGYMAGRSNTTGHSNTFSGYAAGFYNTTGFHNTFSGNYAGYSNQTGAGNVFIGYRAGYNETGDNKLYIANDWADANVLIYGDFSAGNVGIGTTSPSEELDVDGTARLRGIAAQAGATYVHVDGNGKLWKITSSKKYKTNIRELNSDPMAVLELRPVKYQCRISGKEDIGLIAEEVEEHIKDLVIYDNEAKPDAVRYDKVALYLLAVVKAQQEKIAVLEESASQNKSLKQRLGALERTMQQYQFAVAKEVQQ